MIFDWDRRNSEESGRKAMDSGAFQPSSAAHFGQPDGKSPPTCIIFYLVYTGDPKR
jgi:hypothetical protein